MSSLAKPTAETLWEADIAQRLLVRPELTNTDDFLEFNPDQLVMGNVAGRIEDFNTDGYLLHGTAVSLQGVFRVISLRYEKDGDDETSRRLLVVTNVGQRDTHPHHKPCTYVGAATIGRIYPDGHVAMAESGTLPINNFARLCTFGERSEDERESATPPAARNT